jgi:hypothetical protein
MRLRVDVRVRIREAGVTADFRQKLHQERGAGPACTRDNRVMPQTRLVP